VYGDPPLLKPTAQVPERFWQQVYITNILSLLFTGLTLVLLGILVHDFGWTPTSPFILIIAILFLGIIVINRLGYYKIGRLVFCLTPVVATMFLTVYMKIAEPQSYIVYFDSRFFLLSATILPAVVFKLEERVCLWMSVITIAICLLGFDWIHEQFDVGYYQMGFDVPSYTFINYVVTISFIVILSGVFLLRTLTEKAESRLQQQNQALKNKQEEIEAQHKELIIQKEALLFSSERLEEANRVITRQKSDLEQNNMLLLNSVQRKSDELSKTNEELVKRNNDLMQFSYTLSHNLRGPVARLLGLTDMANKLPAHEHEGIRNLIKKSAEDLDDVLKDLGRILDMRNEIYTVKEAVSLESEWNRAVRLLEDKINGTVIDTNFGNSTFVWGVKAMFHSIFYNLLSNALKYQSPNRGLIVRLHANQTNEATHIEFSDNGIGIDLESHGKDMFKLYKRFHPGVHGKGVGLYLVRMQVESMGGNISVDSTPGAGTTFKMSFHKMNSNAKA
jgi:signal transduction histidine kinase